MEDRLDAADEELAPIDRPLPTNAPGSGAEVKRELGAESDARAPEIAGPASRDARTKPDQDSIGELRQSFPAACLADSAAECFEQVRRWRDEGRHAEAAALLRDTLERFDEPVPTDLRTLLE